MPTKVVVDIAINDTPTPGTRTNRCGICVHTEHHGATTDREAKFADWVMEWLKTKLQSEFGGELKDLEAKYADECSLVAESLTKTQQ